MGYTLQLNQKIERKKERQRERCGRGNNTWITKAQYQREVGRTLQYGKLASVITNIFNSCY